MTKKAPAGILIRDMKKYLSLLFTLFVIASCSQTSYKSPHEKRKLTVKNTSGHDVTLTIKARYNSVVYQPNAVIPHAGTPLELKGVPLCTAIPEKGYDWKIDGLKDNIDPTTWTIRDLTNDEKIKVTVYNTVAKKIELTYPTKDGKHTASCTIEAKPSDKDAATEIIYLYDTEYNFTAKEVDPPATPHNNIAYDKVNKIITIKP